MWRLDGWRSPSLAIGMGAGSRGGLDRHRRKFEGLALTLDLSNRSSSPRKDEIGAGAMLFNRFITRLEEIVCLARDSADSISGATTEIAAGNADLSARTGLQAAPLQQTVASLEELRAAVRQDSESGDRANRLSTDAAGMVEDMHHAIQRLNATIDRMSADPALNSDITSLTEGVAFQTHILALNVAVDPTRAGKIGRGFAVVAGQVQNLDRRSADATRGIKDLIGSSVTAIRESTAHALAVEAKMVRAKAPSVSSRRS